jgi:hypothetical protein
MVLLSVSRASTLARHLTTSTPTLPHKGEGNSRVVIVRMRVVVIMMVIMIVVMMVMAV